MRGQYFFLKQEWIDIYQMDPSYTNQVKDIVKNHVNKIYNF